MKIRLRLRDPGDAKIRRWIGRGDAVAFRLTRPWWVLLVPEFSPATPVASEMEAAGEDVIVYEGGEDWDEIEFLSLPALLDFARKVFPEANVVRTKVKAKNAHAR